MKILHLFTFTAPYYWQSVLSETIIYLFAGININKQAQSLLDRSFYTLLQSALTEELAWCLVCKTPSDSSKKKCF